MERAYLGWRINVMTQALQVEDGSLPQGLTVQNAYTELSTNSKNTVVVVRNSTAYPQTLKKKTLVAWAVAATAISELLVMSQLLEGEPHTSQLPKLTARQRQGKLLEELALSGLASWPLELTDSAQPLLVEYHDVFLLQPGNLGCTHSIEHVIKITDDTPFKEWFWWIPPPLVEVVCTHLQEMLDLGAIQPSQSAWCNAVVLVRKKDRSLCFCINFHHLNAHMKTDSDPLPRIQEALESPVGAGHFSCLYLKLGFWQIKMEKSSKQYTIFNIGNLEFFECDHIPFGLSNVLATFQMLMQSCLGKLNHIYCLIYLDDIIVFLHTVEEHLHLLWVVFDQFREYNLKLKPSKCSFFKEEINYLAHWIPKEGVEPSNSNLKAITECALPQTYTEVHAFLGLMGHYWQFIKCFVHITQLLNEHLTGEWSSRRSEQISLSKATLKAFEVLKKAFMTAPILAFADNTQPYKICVCYGGHRKFSSLGVYRLLLLFLQ